jgi:hypothetical protein
VVYVRLVLKNRPVAGAALGVTVQTGTRVLVVLTGSRTNARGQAQARFRIPRLRPGTGLQVVATLRFAGHTAVGTDDLWLRG